MSFKLSKNIPRRLKLSFSMMGCVFLTWLLSELFHKNSAIWNSKVSLQPPTHFGELGFALYGQPVSDLLISGMRVLILCGGLSVVLCAAVALFLGFFLARQKKVSRTAMALMFVLDIFGAIPGFLLSTVVLYAFGSSAWSLIIAFGVANWDAPTRLAWSVGRLVVARPSYLADEALGYPPLRIFWNHYVPEVFGPLSAKLCSLLAGFVVFGTSAVVIGVVAPDLFPWGALLDQGRHYFDIAPHIFVTGWLLVFVSTLILTMASSGIHLLFEEKNPR